MANIVDYKCETQGAGTVTPELAEKLSLVFPDAYLKSEYLQKVTLQQREDNGTKYARLPLCHTLEADAMGAIINYGDANFGPRAGGYALTDPEQLLTLKDIDFSTGRIAEHLDAAEKLQQAGVPVQMDITGPITIFSTLIDLKHLFKAFRKRPDIIEALFAYLERNLLAFMAECRKRGVKLFSYGDSAGGVTILGPDLTERITREFTLPLLKKMEQMLGGDGIVALCPKTTFALIGTELAQWGELDLGEAMSYQDGVVAALGKTTFVGETCIKNFGYRLDKGIIRTVVLK